MAWKKCIDCRCLKAEVLYSDAAADQFPKKNFVGDSYYLNLMEEEED